MYIRYLFEDGLQALQHLFLVVSQSVQVLLMMSSYLKLNLGLSNILLAAASVGNLLGLGDLGTDVLC